MPADLTRGLATHSTAHDSGPPLRATGPVFVAEAGFEPATSGL